MKFLRTKYYYSIWRQSRTFSPMLKLLYSTHHLSPHTVLFHPSQNKRLKLPDSQKALRSGTKFRLFFFFFWKDRKIWLKRPTITIASAMRKVELLSSREDKTKPNSHKTGSASKRNKQPKPLGGLSVGKPNSKESYYKL